MLSLSVISPEGVIYQGEASKVEVPGALASFSILKGHAPLISQLGSGIFSIYSEEGKNIHFVVKDGFVEVKDDVITALVEKIVYPDDINLDSEQRKLNGLLTKVAHSEYEQEAKQKEIENIRAKIRFVNFTKKRGGI